MLVGGCRIARIMPIAVETDRLGALMCTIGKTQRPLAVQKEGLHYHTCYYPESLEVLRAAKEQQVVLGMISNHLAFWFHKECGEALKDLIDPELLLVSSEVACSKPGSQIFELFLQRVGKLHPGIKAADCIFVDDKAENVAAAEALGFQGLLYDARKAQPGDLAKALREAGLPLP
eukprot:symbB.v1.2.036398.t1/scaffold5128.1/size30560/4